MTHRPALTLAGFQPGFAELAEAMLAERQASYPARVAAGKLDQAAADHALYVAGAIAEIWRCAADLATPRRHCCRLTRDEALETLAHAIEVAERRCRRAPDDRRQQQLRDQLAAMRWWHAHYPPRSTYALTMALMLRHDALLATENDTERKAA